jgi:hypothetical protein
LNGDKDDAAEITSEDQSENHGVTLLSIAESREEEPTEDGIGEVVIISGGMD